MEVGKLYRVKLFKGQFRWGIGLVQALWVPDDENDVSLEDNTCSVYGHLDINDVFMCVALCRGTPRRKWRYIYLLIGEKLWCTEDPIEVLSEYYEFEKVS